VYAGGASFARLDPRLAAPGCLYLAGKAEESVVAAKALVASMRRLRPGWPFDLKALLDMEMVRAWRGVGFFFCVH
jgi:cyclin C